MNFVPLAFLLAATLPGAASRLAQSSSSPRPLDRSHAAIDAIHHSGAVQRCWNAFVASDPDASGARFRVRIEVTAAGAVDHVMVLDPIPQPLADCVGREVRRVVLPAGAAITVETTYGFSAGMVAPVPAKPRAG